MWVGLFVGAAVLVAAGVALRMGGRRRSARSLVVGTVVVLVTLVLIGWPVQRHFLDQRYVAAGLPFDAVAEYFRDVEDADVIAFGTLETYPFAGLDLSNRVVVGQGPDTDLDADPCEEWADVVAGRYDYAVLAREPVIIPVTPPIEWFTDDPASELVVDAGDDVVYRLSGPLDPPACRVRT